MVCFAGNIEQIIFCSSLVGLHYQLWPDALAVPIHKGKETRTAFSPSDNGAGLFGRLVLITLRMTGVKQNSLHFLTTQITAHKLVPHKLRIAG